MAWVATAQPALREMIEDPGWQPPAETRTWERGLCGICPSCCAVRVEKTGGRIGRVVPDKDSPMGYICKLGVHSADIVYADARLRYPMKRVGKKGGYEFERIGWNEAFDHIVHRLTADKGSLRARVGRHLHRARILRPRTLRDLPAQGCGRLLGEQRALPLRLAQQSGRRRTLLRLLRHDRTPCDHGADAHQHLLRHRERRAGRGVGCQSGHRLTASRPPTDQESQGTRRRGRGDRSASGARPPRKWEPSGSRCAREAMARWPWHCVGS